MSNGCEKFGQRVIGASATGCFVFAIWILAHTPNGAEFIDLSLALQISIIGFFSTLVIFGFAILFWNSAP